MRSTEEQIERGIELLKLCQRLQSEKDGVVRPEPLVIDKSKCLDQFAKDIEASINNMSALYKLIPMMTTLSELGRKLHEEGKIEVDYGEEFSQKALEHYVAQFGTPSNEAYSSEHGVLFGSTQDGMSSSKNSGYAEMTKEEMLARIALLSDEMDCNDEENRAMQSEIDRLYQKIDADKSNSISP